VTKVAWHNYEKHVDITLCCASMKLCLAAMRDIKILSTIPTECCARLRGEIFGKYV